MKGLSRLLTALVLLVAASLPAVAQDSQAVTPAETKTESPHRFTWGAELGPAIDLCGDDMSVIALAAYFGYANSWIDILGVGAGIDMMMSNSSRAFPLFAIMRTDFSKRTRLVFADMRVGCAFNNAFGERSHTSFYVNPGIGFNLARGKSFQSYIILSYVYNGMSFPGLKNGTEITGVNQIALNIGVTF